MVHTHSKEKRQLRTDRALTLGFVRPRVAGCVSTLSAAEKRVLKSMRTHENDDLSTRKPHHAARHAALARRDVDGEALFKSKVALHKQAAADKHQVGALAIR